MLRSGNEEADLAAKDAINSSITSKIQNLCSPRHKTYFWKQKKNGNQTTQT